MKNSLWASVGLFLVLVGGIVVVVWGNRWVEARQARERTFAFPDTQAIVEIHLVELHYDTIFRKLDLKRTPRGWRIGDTLEAFLQPVQTLLKTLAGQQPRAPVAETARANVLRFLKEHRIEVTLVFADGRQERFYVGGPTPDQAASYMLREGFDQPYEVFLPGHTGYLTTRYYPDLSAWQENVLFSARAADLQAIQLDWMGDPAESWRLERPRYDAPWTLATGEPVDSLAVAEYLLAYAGKFFAEDLANPDSLAGLGPLAELRLFPWKGNTFHLVVYPHSSSPLHYYVKLLHSPYFVHVISRYQMDRLLQRRSHFLKKVG
ncbi:MAG: hypothetical protein KatS3mg026_0043 [Bacteroidia bacterium]|nr:MAG: hypothetical protein KatS3mg026_0043 [Bacteroidia bacterium]